MAPMTAVPPTFINFLKLKSSPKANNRKITPISAQIRILSTSVTVGICSMEGPASIPATIYPNTRRRQPLEPLPQNAVAGDAAGDHDGFRAGLLRAGDRDADVRVQARRRVFLVGLAVGERGFVNECVAAAQKFTYLRVHWIISIEGEYPRKCR